MQASENLAPFVIGFDDLPYCGLRLRRSAVNKTYYESAQILDANPCHKLLKRHRLKGS